MVFVADSWQHCTFYLLKANPLFHCVLLNFKCSSYAKKLYLIIWCIHAYTGGVEQSPDLPEEGDGTRSGQRSIQRPHQLHQGRYQHVRQAVQEFGRRQQGIHHRQRPPPVLQGQSILILCWCCWGSDVDQ